jgi:hypothetical protein
LFIFAISALCCFTSSLWSSSAGGFAERIFGFRPFVLLGRSSLLRAWEVDINRRDCMALIRIEPLVDVIIRADADFYEYHDMTTCPVRLPLNNCLGAIS